MAFFNIANHDSGGRSATVQIMDQIGRDWWTDEGTEAKDFMAAVRDLGELDSIDLEINSPGGNVHQGVSIANFIKQHPANWNAKVVGNAASIASVIACACDTVEMGVGTNFLVHKPSSLLFGMVNADEARSLAQDLDTIENSITEFYTARIEASGKTAEDLDALMREDRYMTSDEAIEWGFADSKSVELQAAACGDTRQVAASNFFAAKSAEYENKLSELNLENARLKEENERLLNPEYASNEQVIRAFAEAEMTSFSGNYLDKNLSESALAASLVSLGELKDVCAAKGLDFNNLGQHINNPLELVINALSEQESSQDDDIDGQHQGKEILANAPNYERAYAPFNTRS